MSKDTRTKWTIAAGDKVCIRGGKIAWTYDRTEAETWLPSIPGARVVDAMNWREQPARGEPSICFACNLPLPHAATSSCTVNMGVPSQPSAGEKPNDEECGYCGGTAEVACSSTNYMPCPKCCAEPSSPPATAGPRKEVMPSDDTSSELHLPDVSTQNKRASGRGAPSGQQETSAGATPGTARELTTKEFLDKWWAEYGQQIFDFMSDKVNHRDADIERLQSEVAQLRQERDALAQAIHKLSMGMGSPAVQFGKDKTIEMAVVEFALKRIADLKTERDGLWHDEATEREARERAEGALRRYGEHEIVTRLSPARRKGNCEQA